MKKYKVSLNKAGALQGLISNLRAYEDELDAKCEKFVRRLADIGITIAETNTGEYTGYIAFRKEVDRTQFGCNAIIYAHDITKIHRSWKTGEAVISPLLMAEFGSGWKAVKQTKISGVGQGTFPGQKHAFDPNGWFWEDDNPSPTSSEDSVYRKKNGSYLHHSMGESPSMPMYNAWLEMEIQLRKVAREVFG